MNACKTPRGTNNVDRRQSEIMQQKDKHKGNTSLAVAKINMFVLKKTTEHFPCFMCKCLCGLRGYFGP